MPLELSEYLHLRACLWLFSKSKKVGFNFYESPTHVINSRASRPRSGRSAVYVVAMPHELSEYLHLRAFLWLFSKSKKVGFNFYESPMRIINSRAAHAVAARGGLRSRCAT